MTTPDHNGSASPRFHAALGKALDLAADGYINEGRDMLDDIPGAGMSLADVRLAFSMWAELSDHHGVSSRSDLAEALTTLNRVRHSRSIEAFLDETIIEDRAIAERVRNSVRHGAPYSHRSMHAHYFLNGDT